MEENFLPSTGPELIAELIATGILRYSSATAAAGSTVHIGLFDTAESDRATLLEGARRSETARVVQTAAHHHGHRIGALARLRDAIADPDNTLDPTAMSDLALQRVVMRAVSGPYLSRAVRLGEDMDHLREEASSDEPAAVTSDVVEPDTRAPISANKIPKGSIMSNAAERTEVQNEPAAISTPPETYAPGHRDPEPEPVTTPLMPTSFPTGTDRRQPGDCPPTWGNVPPRNPNFTGRDDLIEQLRRQLTTGTTTAVLPTAIHGMGGIGKTQTAAEYIYRHLDDYDLVWWIQAAQPAQIRSDLAELAKHLGLPGSSEVHTAVPAVLEALRRGNPVRRWLLVFDAAESPEMVRKFFPATSPSETLVTSRNPAARQFLHICAYFSPEPISRDLFDGVREVSISSELDATLRNRIQLACAIRGINRYDMARMDHGNNSIELHRLVYLRRPVVVTGWPGMGKSSVAFLIVREWGQGWVPRRPVSSRAASKDWVYMYDVIGRVQQGNARRGVESGIGEFVPLGPLGTALLPYERPRVLLIDELDKSDFDPPNDLLNVVEDGEYEVAELARSAARDPEVTVPPDDREGSAVVRRGRVRRRSFPGRDHHQQR